MFRRTVAAILVVVPTLAAAQAPKIFPNLGNPGEYIVEIETPPVLDYSFHGVGGPGTTITMAQDLRGKITGTTKTSGATISGEGVITGKVKTRDGLPYVTLKIVEDGEIDGDATHTVAKLQGSLQGWGAESALVGDQIMKMCMTFEDPNAHKKRICLPNTTTFEQKVPHAGTWQILLSMERFGNEVQALGWLVLASEQPVTPHLYEVDAIGKISPKTGLAKVVVRPRPDGPNPGTVTLIGKVGEDQNGQAYFTAIHAVKGKLLGQSFDEVYDGKLD